MLLTHIEQSKTARRKRRRAKQDAYATKPPESLETDEDGKEDQTRPEPTSGSNKAIDEVESANVNAKTPLTTRTSTENGGQAGLNPKLGTSTPFGDGSSFKPRRSHREGVPTAKIVENQEIANTVSQQVEVVQEKGKKKRAKKKAQVDGRRESLEKT